MTAAGTWYNELGSLMELTIDGANVTGVYQTAVGDASGIYELVGRVDIDGDPDGNGQAIGWSVSWTNDDQGSSHSVTSWSGQYQMNNGEEEITTLWLLTSETSPDYDWAATQINQDVFTRNPPTEEDVQRAQRRRMPSHPV